MNIVNLSYRIREAVNKKVREAIREPRTQEEIIELTGIDEQIVSDVLAQFWDSGEARIDRASRRFQLAA